MSAQDDANLNLENAFAQASTADAESLSIFFKAFLDGPLYVPQRMQTVQLTNTALYPNDFVTVLGLAFEDKIIVPVFSSKSALLDWAGQELISLRLSGSELIARIPQDWWITINPGSEFSKEVSPWEISLLAKEGLNAIPIIAEELKGTEEREPFQVTPTAQSEFPAVRAAISEVAHGLPEVLQVFLLKEQVFDAEQLPQQSLLVAAEIERTDEKRRIELSTALRDAISQLLIGDLFRVKVLTKDEDIMHGILVHFEPFYLKQKPNKSGIFKKLFGG